MAAAFPGPHELVTSVSMAALCGVTFESKIETSVDQILQQVYWQWSVGGHVTSGFQTIHFFQSVFKSNSKCWLSSLKSIWILELGLLHGPSFSVMSAKGWGQNAPSPVQHYSGIRARPGTLLFPPPPSNGCLHLGALQYASASTFKIFSRCLPLPPDALLVILSSSAIVMESPLHGDLSFIFAGLLMFEDGYLDVLLIWIFSLVLCLVVFSDGFTAGNEVTDPSFYLLLFPVSGVCVFSLILLLYLYFVILGPAFI